MHNVLQRNYQRQTSCQNEESCRSKGSQTYSHCKWNSHRHNPTSISPLKLAVPTEISDTSLQLVDSNQCVGDSDMVKMRVVNSHWIEDSVKENKRLPEIKYAINKKE